MQTGIPENPGIPAITALQHDSKYQLYYIAVFDPPPPPYAVFRRYKREHEMDLKSATRQLISSYVIEIYHNDSWELLALQQEIRTLLEALPFMTVGGIYVQQLEVNDDYHEMPPKLEEARVRVYQGVLDFQMIHNPD